MKNNIFITLICVLCMLSCVKEQDGITIVDTDQLTDVFSDSELFMIDAANTSFVYERPTSGIVLPLGGVVGLAGSPKVDGINYAYTIIPESTTAVEGEQFTATTSSSIPAGELTEMIPIMIDLDKCDVGVEYTIGVQLTSSDIDNTRLEPTTYTFTVLCNDPDISGEVMYTSDDNFSGTATSGVANITAEGSAPGVYLIDNYAFGSYVAAYGGEAASWGSLTLGYVCNKISYSGLDNYGDEWSITEVSESNGPKLTFRWENTYGEFGVVTLTRTDGADWAEIGN